MRFLLLALLLFLVWSYAEVTLLLYVAEHTHILVALLLTIFTGIIGIALARHLGWTILARVRLELGRGEVPIDSLLSGALLFVAGMLLLAPGLISDAVGLLLLLPPLRYWLARRIKRRFQYRVGSWWGKARRDRFGNGGDIVDSYSEASDETGRLEDDRLP